MGKKSNGKLRKLRFLERAERKGVDVVAPADTGGYAYMYGTDGSTLRRTYVQG